MANFHLDECVDPKVKIHLKALGHTAFTTREIGLAGRSDPVHLLAAAQNSRVFLTHNGKDFKMLQEAWKLWSRAWRTTQEHAGIIVIPHGTSPWEAQMAHNFLGLGFSVRNNLFICDSGGSWVQFPI